MLRVTNRARTAAVRRRPALAAALAFAVGVWLASPVLPGSGAQVWAFRYWPAAWWSELTPSVWRSSCRLPGWVLSGAVSATSRFPPATCAVTAIRRSGDLLRRVVGEPEIRPEATRLVLEVDSVAYPDSICPRTGKALARFQIQSRRRPRLQSRDRGPSAASAGARTPGGFSWADYLERRGIDVLLEPAPGSPVLQVEPSGAWWLSGIVAPFVAG